MRRRSWMSLTGLFLLSAVACEANGVVLKVYAGVYTPNVITADMPKRLHAFASIAGEWEQLHPGVKVEFIKQPFGDYQTWMFTQLKGDMAPDIMLAEGTWCNSNSRYGWFTGLNRFLERPDPYVVGNKRWLDVFYAKHIDSKRAPNGELYCLPIDLNETGIYYNKDIFRKAGVKPPRTWAELIRVCRKIDDSGSIPFLMTGAQFGSIDWARWILNDQLWLDLLPRINVKSPSVVDEQEIVRAYKAGIWSFRDPRFAEELRILKDWSRYWNKDSLAGTAQTERLFTTGKAAMYWTGSWYLPRLQRDQFRTFDFGIFEVPAITGETSKYAGTRVGPAPGIGGAGATQYTITSSAVRNGKLDLAVDFLMFVTEPKRLGTLVSEAAVSVPNAPDAPVNPALAPFARTLKARHVEFEGLHSDKRFTDYQYRVFQSYLGGNYTRLQTMTYLDSALGEAINRVIAENSQWRFGRDWTILPDQPPHRAETRRIPALLRRICWLLPLALLAGLLAAFAANSRENCRQLRAKKGLYLFVLPTMLLIVAFCYYPIISAFFHSLFDWKGNGEATWIGVGNYIELMHDSILRESAGNLVKVLVVGMILSITAPLVTAEIIFHLKSGRAQYFYRVLYVIPMVVPGVVTLLIWGFIYDYNIGPLNQLLRAVGLGHCAQVWLGNPRIALYSLMLMGFPWIGGFALLIYTAGLQSIPVDVLDSGKIDGSEGLGRIWAIDLPLIRSQIKLLLILGFIGGIQGFQAQLLLTNGGPGYSTMVPGLVLYQNSMLFDRMGYACAIGVALFVVILGLTYVNTRYVKSSTEFEPQ